MKPQRANVFLLTDVNGKYTGVLINRIMYRIEALDDEGIAEFMNGGSLPLVQEVLARQDD